MSNRPFIVGTLFIGTYFVPFLILVGLPLAYIFHRDEQEQWQASHFTFHIHTFWTAVLFVIAIFLIAIIGFFAIAATLEVDEEPGVVLLLGGGLLVIGGLSILAYCGVRIVISMMKSASRYSYR